MQYYTTRDCLAEVLDDFELTGFVYLKTSSLNKWFFSGLGIKFYFGIFNISVFQGLAALEDATSEEKKAMLGATRGFLSSLGVLTTRQNQTVAGTLSRDAQAALVRLSNTTKTEAQGEHSEEVIYGDF